MKYVIDFLQVSDRQMAKKYIFLMGAISVINIVVMFLGRLSSITLRNKMLVSLYERYLVKFIVADNNKIELLGTGKTNNII